MSEESMNEDGDDRMRAEYRRKDLGKGTRGQYHGRMSKGTNLVLLDDKVAQAFPTSEAVNEALLSLTEQTARSLRRSSGRAKPQGWSSREPE